MLIPSIQSRIHEIRGQKVMLDSDLAELYSVETKRLKEQVRRNISRFPGDFMFELSREEIDFLRSQNATLERGKGKHSKFLPFAFTEQGVAMLSSVLRSPKAIEVNIAIMRTFVFIRQFALSHKELTEKLRELESKHEKHFRDIYEALDFLIARDRQEIQQKNRKKIGFTQQ